ncbi:hypothetical protein E2C01_097359 [Portunus trituberculatus]|uniref:Uncharacterized protein n=2 Tax=Portunus trituberculatus TaxID=210409 RepID=A0A5B7K5H9_PORTR|nr:hypothetical protein [Portunus trituberculatus]
MVPAMSLPLPYSPTPPLHSISLHSTHYICHPLL